MDRLQRLLHRNPDRISGTTAGVDVEKSMADGSSELPRRHEADYGFPATPALDPTVRYTADEQLRAFRHLVGITNDRSLAHGGKEKVKDLLRAGAHDTRAAPNVGLYARVVHNEQVAKSGHKWYSLLISAALGLQIIVAAALTALGAADGSRTAVTIFGAVNTVIAGFLTYLKGSGLPSRLKYYQNEWKKLREYIEQRERDFSRAVHGGGPPPPDSELQAEVMHIERMYMETKTDIEVNTPDGYTSISKASQGRNVLSSIMHPQQQQQQKPEGPPARAIHPPEPAHLPGGDFLQQHGGGIASKLQGALGALGPLEKHLSGEHPAGHGSSRGESLATDLEHLLPAGLTEKLKRLSTRVEGDTQRASDMATEAGTTAAGVAASGVATAERAVESAERAGRAAKDDVAQHNLDVARDLEAHERAVKEARRRVEALVGRVSKDVHDGLSSG